MLLWVSEELTYPPEDLFELPPMTVELWIFWFLLLFLFAFLVFLFFSWHTAYFYVDGKVYTTVSAPFSQAIEMPTPQKEGYTFVAWCRDTELEEPMETAYVMRLFNVNFYAKFVPDGEYTPLNDIAAPEDADVAEA